MHPSVQPLGGLHTELRVCFDINVIYVSSFYSPTESSCSVLLWSSTLHQKGELNGAKGLTEGKDEGRTPPRPGQRGGEMRGEKQGPRGLIRGCACARMAGHRIGVQRGPTTRLPFTGSH